MKLRPLLFLAAFLGTVALSLLHAVDTPQLAPPSATYTRTIYLVRHGAYDMTASDEAIANGLTPLGLAEARLVAARLRGMPVEFSSLVSSTLTRARQTADVINQSLPTLHHETTPLLCECMPRTRSASAMQGISPADVQASDIQVNEAFAKYFVPATDHDRDDILVCHGNLIRALVMKALAVDPEAWPGLSVAHCSLTIVQVRSDGSCKVLAIGDTGHIPPNMLSGHTRTNPELVAP